MHGKIFISNEIKSTPAVSTSISSLIIKNIIITKNNKNIRPIGSSFIIGEKADTA